MMMKCPHLFVGIWSYQECRLFVTINYETLRGTHSSNMSARGMLSLYLYQGTTKMTVFKDVLLSGPTQ